VRTLAIGDIHGCLRALDTLLSVVAPTADDRLITLGDYVDRGPDSRGVLDRLIALHATGRLVALRGNHDEMMVEARDGNDRGWRGCGGAQTLASYGIPRESCDLSAIPAAHWHFLEEVCVDWYETKTHFFVHANADPEVPLCEQPRFMLLWEKLEKPCRHVSGKIMVCGHTRQTSGLPLNLGTTICIDTAVYFDTGWLTCLELETGRLWQSNQLGKSRTGWLEECVAE
jgi:serine/threonine protein phosphatase 1